MRFREVKVSRCSGGHIVWEVVYHDGSEGRFHQGLLGDLTRQQMDQLREEAAAFIEVEHRRKWVL